MSRGKDGGVRSASFGGCERVWRFVRFILPSSISSFVGFFFFLTTRFSLVGGEAVRLGV